MGWFRVPSAAAILLVGASVLAVGPAAAPAAAGVPPSPNPALFECDGGATALYVVPPGARAARLEVVSAGGGAAQSSAEVASTVTPGGRGGRVDATIEVEADDAFFVWAGCAGGDAAPPTAGGDGSGWARGGEGGSAESPGGGGGGASAVSTTADALVAVAGAGGGGGGGIDPGQGVGGDGGGWDPAEGGQAGGDAAGSCGGRGATLSAPGAGGDPSDQPFAVDGEDGDGAHGGDGADNPGTAGGGYAGGGGGGGGYFGGGGGGSYGLLRCGGGGGGAGWVAPAAMDVSGAAGQQAGDGYVRITVVPTFPDVPYDHPFFEDVEWMAAQGISSGYGDGTFKPGAVVTRQAMSAFMYRLAGEPELLLPEDPSFADVPEDHPFYDEIEWMADAGISTGYADGTYKPSAPVSRQAMSAFLYRLAGEPELPLPEDPSFADVPEDHPFYDEIEWMADAGISTGYADGTYKPSAPVTRQAMAAFMNRFPTVATSD